MLSLCVVVITVCLTTVSAESDRSAKDVRVGTKRQGAAHELPARPPLTGRAAGKCGPDIPTTGWGGWIVWRGTFSAP